ncbi:hypothetical protein [Amycolatopsis alkalitolerans]|uniref:Uncharacterized protein n=1 Tax=Amycolatopsis alkalitolerans TaxID=2547244 RepID=A0A5C4LRP9_9PSEU|nr:hypothetical protein [Amycolatopsis alkalitolerans]TNC19400.1 hypothetical protein FG385_32470 [Amycolatopsis alkalitolerans]
MERNESGTRSARATGEPSAYCSLLLQAAGILRLRYVQCRRDTTLSPAAADELATVFEGIALNHSDFDQIDPNEAIALAHRLIDDDHPELSGMWPRTG